MQDQRISEAIDKRFGHRGLSGDDLGKALKVHHKAKELAALIVGLGPGSRSLSSALTKLEEAVMFADKAITHKE